MFNASTNLFAMRNAALGFKPRVKSNLIHAPVENA